jgi:hypothetical protein
MQLTHESCRRLGSTSLPHRQPIQALRNPGPRQGHLRLAVTWGDGYDTPREIRRLACLRNDHEGSRFLSDRFGEPCQLQHGSRLLLTSWSAALTTPEGGPGCWARWLRCLIHAIRVGCVIKSTRFWHWRSARCWPAAARSPRSASGPLVRRSSCWPRCRSRAAPRVSRRSGGRYSVWTVTSSTSRSVAGRRGVPSPHRADLG